VTLARPRARFVAGGGGGGPAAAASSVLGGGDLDLLSGGVERLVVDLDVGRGHDRAEIVVSHLSSLADTEPGSDLQVAIGLDGDPVDVLHVDIASVEDRPGSRRIVGLSPTHRLDDLLLTRSYVQQTVADIVRDVLTEAGLDAGSIDGSRTMAQYHLDGRRSAWRNLHLLAELFGAEITTGADGSVSFTPAPGVSSGGLGGALGAVAGAAAALGLAGAGGLRRGANVAGWRSSNRGDARAVPSVAPLGAASPFGSPRGHHVLKAGDGETGPTIVSPSLRDTDGSEGASQALAARADRHRQGGRFVVVGDPTLRAGADVTIDDDSWHVLAVRHRIDSTKGYLCELTVEATP
jgi:hypothetical protein